MLFKQILEREGGELLGLDMYGQIFKLRFVRIKVCPEDKPPYYQDKMHAEHVSVSQIVTEEEDK